MNIEDAIKLLAEAERVAGDETDLPLLVSELFDRMDRQRDLALELQRTIEARRRVVALKILRAWHDNPDAFKNTELGESAVELLRKKLSVIAQW